MLARRAAAAVDFPADEDDAAGAGKANGSAKAKANANAGADSSRPAVTILFADPARHERNEAFEAVVTERHHFKVELPPAHPRAPRPPAQPRSRPTMA